MRTKILAANWKMNKTVTSAVSFVEEFKRKISFGPVIPRPKAEGSRVSKPEIPRTGVLGMTEVIIAPPFTALESVSKAISTHGESPLKLCAQNMHWEKEGAFTGEISAPMLVSLGCEYVIIGHSERRQLFFESLDRIQKKVAQAFDHKLKVILCVGETLEEREAKKTLDVVKKQVVSALEKVSHKNQLNSLVIAYEPVWAIGTGKNATVQEAEEVHRFIRKIIWDVYDMDLATHMPIIYGGSVSVSNIKDFSLADNIDGALVGGASLETKTFIEILKQMA